MKQKAELENGYIKIANDLALALARSSLSASACRVAIWIACITYGRRVPNKGGNGWITIMASRITLYAIIAEIGIDHKQAKRAMQELTDSHVIIKNECGHYGFNTKISEWSCFRKNGIKSTPIMGALSRENEKSLSVNRKHDCPKGGEIRQGEVNQGENSQGEVNQGEVHPQDRGQTSPHYRGRTSPPTSYARADRERVERSRTLAGAVPRTPRATRCDSEGNTPESMGWHPDYNGDVETGYCNICHVLHPFEPKCDPTKLAIMGIKPK